MLVQNKSHTHITMHSYMYGKTSLIGQTSLRTGYVLGHSLYKVDIALMYMFLCICFMCIYISIVCPV